MDGGVLGLGAGSTISGYEIAGIGHGVHMRLVTYPIRLASYWAWVWVVWCLSGYPKENVCSRRAVPGRSSPRSPLPLKVWVEALQVELAKVEESAAGHRADFERERERADRLMAELLRVTADTLAAQEAAAPAGGELAGLRARPW